MTLISEASKKEKELFVSVKDDVMAYFNQENITLLSTVWEAESFTTQVVAGINYSVIYRINSTQKIEVRFWKKLDGTVEIT